MTKITEVADEDGTVRCYAEAKNGFAVGSSYQRSQGDAARQACHLAITNQVDEIDARPDLRVVRVTHVDEHGHIERVFHQYPQEPNEQFDARVAVAPGVVTECERGAGQPLGKVPE